MSGLMTSYTALIQASAVVAALTLVQFLVADLAGIRSKHVPGTSLKEEKHSSFLFRAVRAHANTMENLATYVLLFVLAMIAGASPKWTGIVAWTFVAARAAHMTCYYADWRIARSVSFAVGLTAQFVMLGLVVLALL